MASTTNVVQSTTPKVEITDPSLLAFHNMRKSVFDETEAQAKEFAPKWEQQDKASQQFEIEVRKKGSDLQHKNVVNPGKEQLEKDREGFLLNYWNFMAECERINVFASGVQKTITFLTPQPRVYTDEKRMEQDQPEFLAQLKAEDEICRGYVATLSNSHQQLTSLNQKMVTFLKGDVAWSLQRFCQIVDNEGKPITTWSRLMNNVTTPVIPKPKAKVEESKTQESGQTPKIEEQDSIQLSLPNKVDQQLSTTGNTTDETEQPTGTKVDLQLKSEDTANDTTQPLQAPKVAQQALQTDDKAAQQLTSQPVETKVNETTSKPSGEATPKKVVPDGNQIPTKAANATNQKHKKKDGVDDASKQ